MQRPFRLLGVQNLRIYAPKLIDHAGSGRFATRLGIAELAEMNVFDSDVFHRAGERAFGETRFARLGALTDVDENVDFAVLEGRNELDW